MFILSHVVLPQNVQVFVNDTEVFAGSTVVLVDSKPVVISCFVEGAKPVADCVLDQGQHLNPYPLTKDIVDTNSASDLLFDTTATLEFTPTIEYHDGLTWRFFGYNDYGSFAAAAAVDVTFEVAGNVYGI